MVEPITLGAILGKAIPSIAGGLGQGLAGRSKTTQTVSVSQSQASSVNASVSPVIVVNTGGGTVDRPIGGGEVRAAPVSAPSTSVPNINDVTGTPYSLSPFLSLPAPVRGRASLDLPYPIKTTAALAQSAGASGVLNGRPLAGFGVPNGSSLAGFGTPLLLAGAGLLLFMLLRKGKR